MASLTAAGSVAAQIIISGSATDHGTPITGNQGSCHQPGGQVMVGATAPSSLDVTNTGSLTASGAMFELNGTDPTAYNQNGLAGYAFAFASFRRRRNVWMHRT